jgi:protein TonB
MRMAHDLFSEVSTPSIRVRASSRWTIPLSIAAHVVIVALVLIIPLMAADVLPMPSAGNLQFVAAVAPPPQPPAPRMMTARVTATPAVIRDPNVAPIAAPDKIADEPPAQFAGPVADGGIDAIGVTNGVSGSVNLGTPVAVADPPPPPAPKKPFRIGGAIREPVKVKHVSPIYPAIAQSARVSGKVIIDAVIGTDGAVRDARILSGMPLLNQAALDAVRQWRYSPTMLNGEPVQVVMTVTVDFRLN